MFSSFLFLLPSGCSTTASEGQRCCTPPIFMAPIPLHAGWPFVRHSPKSAWFRVPLQLGQFPRINLFSRLAAHTRANLNVFRRRLCDDERQQIGPPIAACPLVDPKLYSGRVHPAEHAEYLISLYVCTCVLDFLEKRTRPARTKGNMNLLPICPGVCVPRRLCNVYASTADPSVRLGTT